MNAKRLFDVMLSGIALICAGPLIGIGALGIRLGGGAGPIFYRARRIGRDQKPFTMYKLRTMRAGTPAGDGTGNLAQSAITAKDDPRVFPFGAVLRRFKIDELPQLWNVLRGDMSIVGPRPEDPRMVQLYYAPLHYETFRVPPGLTSPGSIYSYTHGEAELDSVDPERCYAERLLPIKLALDLVYMRRMSVGYDVAVIVRTAWVIGSALCGRRKFSLTRELPEAQQIMREVGPVRMSA